MRTVVVDRPRDEILRMAQRALDERRPGSCAVHFTYVCANCKTRCALEEANTLYERGECFNCGRETVIRNAGFLLVQRVGRERRPSRGGGVMQKIWGFGTLRTVDIPAGVEMLAVYLHETGDLDEAAGGGRPSVARFEELLSMAAGNDVAITVDPVVDGLSILLRAENRRRFETVVSLLAIVAGGHITVIDGEHVQRYVMRGGTSFVEEGRLVVTGALRPLTAW
jgi:hypothetical protein